MNKHDLCGMVLYLVSGLKSSCISQNSSNAILLKLDEIGLEDLILLCN